MREETHALEFNREQAQANHANSNAILAHTQRVICIVAADDMEPDRLDSWYRAAETPMA